jgi:phosphoribosylglycinamide formyltransferase-1
MGGLMGSRAKIAVFISGSGSNLQSLIDASSTEILSGEIVLVISSKLKAYGLERARNAGIDTFVFRLKDYPGKEEAVSDLMAMLEEYKVEYIALAGYLKLLPEQVVKKFTRKIANIHPALLPKYGGEGMYGHFVHEAVLAAGDKESGPTVHLVDEIYDHGKILLQKKIPVEPDDTPDSLAARVLKAEHQIYPVALDNLIKGKYN